jgi:two-component system response regulator NreC
MSDPILSQQPFTEQSWSTTRVDASPFRSAFEHAAIGMVLADTDGVCLAANRAFCEMVGYSEAELQKIEFAQITHPDDLQENLRLGQQLIRSEIQSFKYEKRYIHKQGHLIWTLLSASLVRDSDGHPLYIISQIQDISERRHAEAAERGQRELAEALRDTAEALSTTHNLDELLDRVLENAHRIVPHDLGAVLLIDDHRHAYFARTRYYSEPLNTGVLSTTRLSVRETANLHVMAEVRKPLIISDVQLYPGWVWVPETYWIRSYVGVPICIEGQAIGFISLAKVQPDFFTRQHAEHLQALAQQAAIAIDNARVVEAERRKIDMIEALRETAAALNSTLDLNEVFDLILTNAARVVPYDAINIMLLDDQGGAAVARSRGYEVLGIADWVKALKMPAQSVAGLRQIVNTHRPYRVPDIQADRHWVGFPEMSWLRSYLGVPIRVKGQVVGFLNFDSATPQFYTAEHARRAQAFADQVALAMQNARSYEAIQRNVRRLTLLHQVGVNLAKTQSAPQLHQQLVRTAMLLAEADSGALLLYDQVSHLIITALENFPASLLGRGVPLGHGLNGQAAQLRQIQTISDYADFADRVSLFDRLPVGAVIALPLVWQDRLVGTLSVVYQAARQFSQEDLHTLDLFAALAAAALEQRRAMAEAQAREAEARSLSTRLTTAQEEERARIASLLHDSIGGQLTVIQKNSEALRDLLLEDEQAAAYLASNLELLQQTHQQVRHLAMDLNARALADFGLAPAARQYIDRLCASTGLSIKLHITGQVRRLPAEVERIAFRGLQEALTNTLRHAHATEIAAQLHLGHRTLRLTVQDNGRGFDQALPQQGTALGLPYLRRQVESRGGEFLIESSPGNGAIVALHVPLHTAPDSTARRTRVLVVDDHEMVRQGLRQLLAQSSDFVCVAEAADGHAALRQAEEHEPRLIIMDVKLPDGSGIETTRQLMKRVPRPLVIIYTYHDDEAYLEQALLAGAHGYVLKSDPNQLIMTALRAVHAGEMFISPAVADKWEQLQTRPTISNPLDSLSSRERQVLQLVASGQPNQRVATRLGISVRTVEVHRRNIMDKVGVKNAAQLIKFSVEHNLI